LSLVVLAGCKDKQEAKRWIPLAENRNRSYTVLPLGDSLTRGVVCPVTGPLIATGGYRGPLYGALHRWSQLESAALTFRFVGHIDPGTAIVPGESTLEYQTDNAGISGYRIDELTALIPTLSAGTVPALILLMAGSNDVRQDYDLANTGTRLTSLVSGLRTAFPSALIFVASIVPYATAPYAASVASVNAQVRSTVQTIASSRVRYVAMHESVNETFARADGCPDTDTSFAGKCFSDDVHLSPGGYSKMAEVWGDAIAQASTEVVF
jgi:lysophospholipase L1-like esterase